MSEQLKRLVIAAFFLVVLVLGLARSQSAGTFWDEGIERRTGNIALLEYIKLVSPSLYEKGKTQLGLTGGIEQHGDRYYGVVLQYPQALFENLILKSSDTALRWQVRHAFLFLFFFLGLLALYGLLRKLGFSRVAALMGVLLVLLSPRILGESFYNIKDIGLLSATFWALWAGVRFLRDNRWSSGLVFAALVAVACSVRLTGALIALAVLGFWLWRRWSDRTPPIAWIPKLMAGFLLTLALIYAFYPVSWYEPLDFLPRALAYMMHHPWRGDVLFLGQILPNENLPWYYLPTWVGLTLPGFFLVLWVLGLFSGLARRRRRWEQDFTVVLSSFAVGTLLLVVVAKPSLYDGWRQFYLLFALLVPSAVEGLRTFLLEPWRSRRVTWRTWTLAAILSVDCGGTIVSIGMLEPYQNVYFNPLAGPKPGALMEADYWALSYRDAWGWVGQQRGASPTTVAGVGPMAASLEMLPSDLRVQYKVIEDADWKDADYRFFLWRAGQVPPEGEPVHKVDRAGIPLVWVYQVSHQ